MPIQEAPSLSRFLRTAIVTGVESAVQVHISRGDDLNARDEKGQTPLMISAARNKAAICKLLLAAGANANLLDPSGRNALGIARAAGALEAASTIEAACAAHAPSDQGSENCETANSETGEHERQSSCEATAPRLSGVEAEKQAGHCTSLPQPDTAAAAKVKTESRQDPGGADDDVDLTGWEAEEDCPAPVADPSLSASALEIQGTITGHRPIDTSADWYDFDAFLPEYATPLRRADNAEARERVRLVLLRAIREGSVPVASIEDLTRGDGGTPDEEAGVLLAMVINDLGAETDERLEHWAPHESESFEVYVSPIETPDEAEALDDALAFVDDLANHRNEPLRIYQREFQREPLLTAETEVALGQSMERGVEKALDALALWPSGIVAVLNAAQEVSVRAKPLRWISSGPPVDPHEIRHDASAETGIEIESDSELTTETDDSDEAPEAEAESPFGLDSKESTDEIAAFRAKAEALSHLSVGNSQDDSKESACRNALASLGLSRGFLAELADLEMGPNPGPALAFRQAMKAYRSARDRMTVANLKLVHSIAKKYLYSGQPLDDLLQEGNIGLIKAADRFNWRRGFKFSTYATWWIRQQVSRFVADKSKTIRLPVHVYEKTQRIAQAARAYELKHGQAPTAEEIAELVAIPAEKVVTLGLASMEPLPIHEIDAIDDQIAADVKDQYIARDPSDIVGVTQLISAIDRLLGVLKHKEALVIRMRFGIGIQEPMTLEEIGSQLDVTRERIRQIEAQALRKLKHPVRLDLLSREFNGVPLQSLESDDPSGGSDTKEGGEVPAELNRSSPKLEPTKLPVPNTSLPNESSATTLQKLLDYARAIGIVVEDYKEGPDRRIWVHLTEAPDSRSRKIIRKLIYFGFTLWPGKGYWR